MRIVVIKALPYLSYVTAAIIGVIAWRNPGPALTTALILSIVTGLMGQLFDLRTLFHQLQDDVRKISPREELEQRIRAKCRSDDFLQSRYEQLNRELADLAEGNYSVHTIENIYLDDIRQISRLKKGEILRSSCPISNKQVDALKQINDPYYTMSMEAHAKASARGVKVHRLYIFNDETMLSPQLLQHLNNIPKAKNEVRVVFRDRVERANIDFLVFGERAVSVGGISYNTGMCVVTHVTEDRAKIREATGRFDEIWETAHHLQKLTEDAAYRSLSSTT